MTSYNIVKTRLVLLMQWSTAAQGSRVRHQATCLKVAFVCLESCIDEAKMKCRLEMGEKHDAYLYKRSSLLMELHDLTCSVQKPAQVQKAPSQPCGPGDKRLL